MAANQHDQRQMPKQQVSVSGYLSDRIYGTLFGQCIGDAIGLLTEFMTKTQASKYYKSHKNLEYEHKVPDKHRSRWRVGDWTDDSDQMILIIDSLIDMKGKVDKVDYAKKIYSWSKEGFPELGDFGGNGLGSTTYQVLKHAMFRSDPHYASHEFWQQTGEFVAPNGGVQRTSVLGIYMYHDLDKVIENTLEICKVTHADYRCQASCVAVSTAIALMCQEKHAKKGVVDVDAVIKEAFHHAKKCIPETYPRYQEYTAELKEAMDTKRLTDLKLDEPKKIGYTFKTLGAGFWALKQSDFRKAMQEIVMEAGDADTNAAVAGALLGCKLGKKSLPGSWLDGLVHKEWLLKRISKFLEVAQISLVKSRT